MATKDQEIKAGCLSRVKPDEPIFVLRAQDRLAPTLVRHWVNLAMLAGDLSPSDPKITEALDLADEMETWQLSNRAKWPD